MTTGNVYTDANGNSLVYLGGTTGTPTKASVGDVLTAIDIASGVQRNAAGVLTLNSGQTASTVSGGGALVLKSSTGADLSITGKADTLAALKLTGSLGGGNVTVGAARTTGTDSLGNLIQDGSDVERRWPHHHLQERADAGCLRDAHWRQRRRSRPTVTATPRSTCRARRSPTC